MPSYWQNLLAKSTVPKLVSAIDGASDEELYSLYYDWRTWARPEQLPPSGDWSVWWVNAGRGFGKTRAGAEWVKHVAMTSCTAPRIALIGPTAADVRDVMIEGDSGIMNICPPHFRPLYEPSKRRVTFPNGAVAYAYSAEEPERLRGPQHHYAWADEVAAWKYPDAWDQMQFGLRLGKHPQVVVTTTPKPKRWLRDVMKQEGVVVTQGSTYDNLGNLAPSFRKAIISKYEGTTLGRQELMAEMLDEAQGAIWKRALIDACRLTGEAEQMRRVVVGVDPATTGGPNSDATGIVVCGLGESGKLHVMADHSVKDSPAAWARKVVEAYHEHKADCVIAESNQGGEMVSEVIRHVDARVPVQLTHASRGKAARAEPVFMMYEQGKVRHAPGLTLLEDELCNWVPGDKSPDRMDAMVYALTELDTGNAGFGGLVNIVGDGY